MENSSIFMEREKVNDSKRECGYVEPKLLKLTEVASKNSPLMEELAASYNVTLEKTEKRSRRTFLDFVSMSNHEKNMIFNEKHAMALIKKDPRPLIKEEQPRKSKKVRNGLLEDFIQEEVFTMKSLTLNKSK
jgi:hypothetical protein